MVSLDEAMTPTNTITAEHHQVGLDIIPGVLADVVKRESVRGTTHHTFTPAVMQGPKKLGVTNGRTRARIRRAAL